MTTGESAFAPSTRLREVLAEARNRGLLGPAALDDHVIHASAMAAACSPSPPLFLDLGSGGGVPGLVLLELWPAATAVLLDAASRRCRFLTGAAAWLDAAERTRVIHARAEDAAHDAELRGQFPCVLARAFGPPAVTAECAAGFVSLGGLLVVSAPPGVRGQWHESALEELGLAEEDAPGGARSVVVFRKAAATPERFPRRPGVPSRRPLW